MSKISPLAVVSKHANLASDVEVGPYAIIGDNVTIGSGCVIAPHVVIKGITHMGRGNKIWQFASIGEDTSDLKYGGEPTKLIIGDNNNIREGVTIHRGTMQDNGQTVIGNNNLIMAYAHVGHDSVIGNNCILVNNASLAGHVIIGDYAVLSGFTLVHQRCQIGAHAFSGMGCAIGKDVPAFVTVAGNPAKACSINIEGLKRRGFNLDVLTALRNAYKIIYRQGLTVEQALIKLQDLAQIVPEVNAFVTSIKNSTRGIVR